MKAKALNLPVEHFIGSYYIDENVCDKMLDFFWENKHKHEETKMPNETKECIEFGINPVINVFEPNHSYLNELRMCLADYVKTYNDLYNINFSMKEPYNIQHYKTGQGFYKWHNERDNDKYSDRCLVFMTYLNDVPDGGTEFKNQNIQIIARKGLTLIWPTDWTHTHRGVVSFTKEKTIITGWFHLNDQTLK